MPNKPPPLPPRWRRQYAHVISLELICPRCGRLYRTRSNGNDKRAMKNRVYDRASGIFTCTRCRYRAYVGVILWPATGRHAIPEDHVLTPGEAAELRAELSAVTKERVAGVRGDPEEDGQRRRPQVNLRCHCGEECPVHRAGEGAGEGEVNHGEE